MTPEHQKALGALGEMCERYPDWRVGQIIANLIEWELMPMTPQAVAAALYDIEDETLAAAVYGHFERRARLEAEAQPVQESAVK